MTPANLRSGEPLPSALFAAPALLAAPLLLGQILIRQTGNGEIACRIVETESYGGAEDLGSHAAGGRRTARTEIMFHAGGVAYIYLIYGMHHCLNVVTGQADDPQAVLIRAVQPLSPEDAARMAAHRGRAPRRPAELSGGPGRLCRVLRIDRSLGGCRLDRPGDSPLWLERGDDPKSLEIMQAPRINIPYAGEYAARPWRFYLRDNPYVSVLDPAAVRYPG
ncbi:DNA-3-methyladenine glycosylase [Paenibacillus glufosinatiresistens]|uniref:DNA-3-methyladenine glycosylase n=1 Tax=Paenibacillus glufosinatiresistens TaxID=3070657 RepID=UPI00286DE81B|nr:DNA-3-methyladenine glycosylase [Paenibacillus sp. YX.27]